jgi:hypothetical protein
MTRNYRFIVAAALLGISPSVVSIPTASAAGVTPQKTARPFFKKSAKKKSSLSFQQFMRLSRADQLGYLALIKQTLVEMDRHPSGRHASGAWDRSAIVAVQEAFEKLLFCSAYAGTDDKYCLNQGVVIPTEGGANGQTCTVSPDMAMHTFDTRKVLAPLGDEMLKCPAGPDGKDQMPCSPFFGIKDDGHLYCTGDNSTPTCDKISKGDKGSFLNALTECGKGTPPPSTIKRGEVEIKCQDLVGIFEDQSKIIDGNCDEPQKFCSLVRKRVDTLLVKLSGDKDTSDALATIDQARAAVSTAGDAPTADCAPGQKPGRAPASVPPAGAENAGVPQPAPPPSTANAPECPKNVKDMSGPDVKSDALTDMIDKFMEAQGKDDPTCINITLPGDRSYILDRSKDSGGVWLVVKKDGQKSTIPMTFDDYFMLQNAWDYSDPNKEPLKNLLDQTLPTAAPVGKTQKLTVFDETKLALPAACQNPTDADMKTKCTALASRLTQTLNQVRQANLVLKDQPFETRTWTTADGTLLSYNINQIPVKKEAKDQFPGAAGMTVVTVQVKGEAGSHNRMPFVAQIGPDPAPGPAGPADQTAPGPATK